MLRAETTRPVRGVGDYCGLSGKYTGRHPRMADQPVARAAAVVLPKMGKRAEYPPWDCTGCLPLRPFSASCFISCLLLFSILHSLLFVAPGGLPVRLARLFSWSCRPHSRIYARGKPAGSDGGSRACPAGLLLSAARMPARRSCCEGKGGNRQRAASVRPKTRAMARF